MSEKKHQGASVQEGVYEMQRKGLVWGRMRLTCYTAGTCSRAGFWEWRSRGPFHEVSFVSAGELRVRHSLSSLTPKHACFIAVCRWQHNFKCFYFWFLKYFVTNRQVLYHPTLFVPVFKTHKRPMLPCSCERQLVGAHPHVNCSETCRRFCVGQVPWPYTACLQSSLSWNDLCCVTTTLILNHLALWRRGLFF